MRRSLGRGGGGAHHRSARAVARRAARTAGAAFQVGRPALIGGSPVRAGHRHHGSPPAGAGTSGHGDTHVAVLGHPAAHDPAALVHQSGDEDRRLLRHARHDRALAPHPLEDQGQPDAGPGSRQRGGVGEPQDPVPGPGRPGAATSPRRHGRPGAERGRGRRRRRPADLPAGRCSGDRRFRGVRDPAPRDRARLCCRGPSGAGRGDGPQQGRQDPATRPGGRGADRPPAPDR